MSDLHDKVKTLEDAIEAKDREIKGLEDKIKSKASSGMPGFVVESPNKQFNGFTLGFRFTNGMAFVPDSTPKVELIIKDFQADFKYDTRHVDDFSAAPAQLQSDIGKSIAEVYTGKRA